MTDDKNCERLEGAIASLAERVYRLEQHVRLAEQRSPTTNLAPTVGAYNAPPKVASITPAPSSPGKSGSAGTMDLESRIGGSWLNRAGAVAILFGVSYFLKYAFDNAWIGPRARVVLGLLAGLGLVYGSEYVRRRGWEVFSYSLKALGFGVLYLSIWASSQLYNLIGPGMAFAGMILVTACAAGMALMLDSQLVAGMAVLGGFLTPVLLSTGENNAISLFAYIAFLDFGVVALLRYRPWNRIAIGATAGTFCLLFSWHQRFYSTDQFSTTILAASLFFALFVVLPLSSGASLKSVGLAPVVVGNAALSYLWMFSMLNGIGHGRAPALVALAMSALYFALGFSRTFGGQLVSYYSAQAVVLLTLAIPVGLEAKWITVAWLVEGAALVWAGNSFHSRVPVKLGGIALALGIARLLTIDEFTIAHLVFNERMLTYTIAVGALALVARTSSTSRWKVETWVVAIVTVSASVLAFLAFNLEIQDFWKQRLAGASFPQVRNLTVIRDFAYSALWMGCGGVLIGIGFWKRSRLFRWQALALITITVAKVFLYDTMSLDQGYRIVSFIALGVLLLGISLFYQRDGVQKFRGKTNGV